MSGVVLRCPNCGTTRSTGGECEACHEAQVRYFCSNHEPGRWLDGEACSQCGARFGVTARPPVHRRPASPAPAGGDGARTRTPPPVRSAPPATTGAGSGTTPSAGPRSPARPRRPGPTASPDSDGAAAPPGWREVLIAAARAAQRRRTAAGPAAGLPHRPRRAGGCLAQLFLFVVFVLLSLMMFGTGFLRIFVPF